MREFDGKTVLITGGTGHLGSSICHSFADKGAEVLVNGRTSETVLEQVEALNNLGYKASPAIFDITSSTEIRHFVNSLTNLNILVNNAYSGGAGSIQTSSKKEFLDSFSISVVSTQELFLATLPLLKKSVSMAGDAAVLNICSMYAVVAPDLENYSSKSVANPPFYGAAKAGLLNWTRYAAAEFASDGIRVNSICPGAFPSKKSQKDLRLMEVLTKKVPMKRLGKPEEISEPVTFLCSTKASYITGANLLVDGGWTIN